MPEITTPTLPQAEAEPATCLEMVGDSESVTAWRQFDPTEASGLRLELLRLERQAPLSSSSRQRQLLRYLFEECLAGRYDRISQYTIAFECFGLGEGFDAAANTMVRSHALRLRKTLKSLALPHGRHRILMADRGYRLVFESADLLLKTDVSAFQRIRVKITEPTVRAGITIEPSFPRRLAAAMVEAIAGKNDLFSAVGPLPAAPSPIAAPSGADFILAGEICEQEGKPCVELRVSESSGGRCLWYTRIECEPGAMPLRLLRELAEQLIARITGDWGAICSSVARKARAGDSDELIPLEAVAIARQYLTHFHYEQLARCVRSLRRVVAATDESSVPATLAVVLSMACAVEPRWLEPLDRQEIRSLAARAARLDPEAAWTRLALAVSVMLDGRRSELVEMAKRADREADTPVMLLGALGSLLCFQNVETDLGEQMITRFIQGMTGYPRLVHLALAMCKLAAGNTAAARRELANYGVPWGWASPLVSAACAALDGDADSARADWQRVIDAYPDFPKRWRDTVATQWHEEHLQLVFHTLESVGIDTGCLHHEDQ